jgi:hypothetical protein
MDGGANAMMRQLGLGSFVGLILALSFVVPADRPKAMLSLTGRSSHEKVASPNPVPGSPSFWNLFAPMHFEGTASQNPVLGSPFFAGPDASENPNPSHQAPIGDETLRSKIVGTWTTTTAPGPWKTTTVAFLESGEYHASRPLLVNGIPIVHPQGGEKIPVQNEATGTWDLVGENIHIHVTHATMQGSLGFFALNVKGAGDNRLSLDRAGEKLGLTRSANDLGVLKD